MGLLKSLFSPASMAPYESDYDSYVYYTDDQLKEIEALKKEQKLKQQNLMLANAINKQMQNAYQQNLQQGLGESNSAWSNTSQAWLGNNISGLGLGDLNNIPNQVVPSQPGYLPYIPKDYDSAVEELEKQKQETFYKKKLEDYYLKWANQEKQKAQSVESKDSTKGHSLPQHITVEVEVLIPIKKGRKFKEVN